MGIDDCDGVRASLLARLAVVEEVKVHVSWTCWIGEGRPVSAPTSTAQPWELSDAARFGGERRQRVKNGGS